MCISGIYAFTNMSIVSVENELNTGAINIELKEYTMAENGKEVLYNPNIKDVLPGEKVSFIPRISNLGGDCYVRAKVTYTDINNNNTKEADNNIEIEKKNWIKCGDYWYYKLVVKSGENVDLFKTFKIPEDISNEYQGKDIQINITTEAVQAKNFKPDFESASPWQDVSIKKAKDNSYKTDKVQSNTNVKIEYENNADLYIDVPDTFFGELSYIFPGDIISEEAIINNKSSNEIDYFVSTGNLDENNKEVKELINKLKLTIKIDDKVIYEGNVLGIENLSLGKYKENESAKVTFMISVPKNLENEYSALNSVLKWKFTVSGEEKIDPPQTGDVKTIVVFTIFFVSAIGLITSLVLEKKSKKDNR